MKRVLTFGTFDIFHPGHEHYLKEAKKYGDELYVVVSRDKTVLEVKGRETVNNENKRLEYIRSLDYVSGAFLGSDGDKYKIIEEIGPDVIVFGYDQISFTKDVEKILKERGLNVEIVRLTKGFKPDVYKSSKLRG